MSYHHFSLEERRSLQEYLSNGLTMREIAYVLGRNVSSISREIKRNRSTYPMKKSNNRYKYNAWRANVLSIMRRREKTRERLQENTEEWDYIVEKLKLYWSPEQIAARWRLDYPERKTFCFSTIYRAIKKEKLPGIREKTHLRRRGKGYTPRNSCYNSIQPDRLVTDWPEEIRKRTRIGDWEGDTIYGGVGKGGLVTLLDRKTRVVRAELLMKRESGLTKDTVVAALRGYPVHSITFDNGSEFAQFHEMESELNTVVYFAEPHKPWQRGSNENANDILRFFFPKGFDFRQVTQEDVDFVVDLINSRPRKILGWNSPIALFRDEFPVALT